MHRLREGTSPSGFYKTANGVLTGWHDVGASSTAYSVVGNSDNTSDILYRNNSTAIPVSIPDVASAREDGVISSFLAPLDKPFPMVATKDIGTLAARLIQEDFTGQRIVELEGPRRISPNDLAAAFAKALGRDVRAEIVPREGWETMFRSQGAKNPYPLNRMLDGFNEGWIEFADGGAKALKGSTDVETVIAELVRREADGT
jgi:uncharacterized protein YbjT (DUF2867 family)